MLRELCLPQGTAGGLLGEEEATRTCVTQCQGGSMAWLLLD